MADGLFYHDSRAPFINADAAAVTLATTDKALYPAAAFPVLGGQYWWVGKRIFVKIFGRVTTVLTPGNFTVDVYWGSGADATGTILASSAAVAATASQTNLSFTIEVWIHCRSIGATGTLFCHGHALWNEAVIGSKMFIPASAPAAVTVDTTAANIISIQLKRSGSTAETAQIHDIQVTPLN